MPRRFQYSIPNGLGPLGPSARLASQISSTLNTAANTIIGEKRLADERKRKQEQIEFVEMRDEISSIIDAGRTKDGGFDQDIAKKEFVSRFSNRDFVTDTNRARYVASFNDAFRRASLEDENADRTKDIAFGRSQYQNPELTKTIEDEITTQLAQADEAGISRWTVEGAPIIEQAIQEAYGNGVITNEAQESGLRQALIPVVNSRIVSEISGMEDRERQLIPKQALAQAAHAMQITDERITSTGYETYWKSIDEQLQAVKAPDEQRLQVLEQFANQALQARETDEDSLKSLREWARKHPQLSLSGIDQAIGDARRKLKIQQQAAFDESFDTLLSSADTDRSLKELVKFVGENPVKLDPIQRAGYLQRISEKSIEFGRTRVERERTAILGRIKSATRLDHLEKIRDDAINFAAETHQVIAADGTIVEVPNLQGPTSESFLDLVNQKTKEMKETLQKPEIYRGIIDQKVYDQTPPSEENDLIKFGIEQNRASGAPSDLSQRPRVNPTAGGAAVADQNLQMIQDYFSETGRLPEAAADYLKETFFGGSETDLNQGEIQALQRRGLSFVASLFASTSPGGELKLRSKLGPRISLAASMYARGTPQSLLENVLGADDQAVRQARETVMLSGQNITNQIDDQIDRWFSFAVEDVSQLDVKTTEDFAIANLLSDRDYLERSTQIRQATGAERDKLTIAMRDSAITAIGQAVEQHAQNSVQVSYGGATFLMPAAIYVDGKLQINAAAQFPSLIGEQDEATRERPFFDIHFNRAPIKMETMRQIERNGVPFMVADSYYGELIILPTAGEQAAALRDTLHSDRDFTGNSEALIEDFVQRLKARTQ